MKKMVIVALVGICAFFANAAAVNWTASGIVDPVATATAGKNVAASGWLGYMILASDYDTVAADLQSGKTDSLVKVALGDASKSNTKGQFLMGTAAGNVAAGSQTFYMIVLNSSDVATATGYYAASATATVDASLDTTVIFGSQATKTKVADNWGSVGGGGSSDVPEPTSGILLLLGMAGLALRRKHA